MRHIWKRGLALLFALILMLTLAVPALAEEPGDAPDTPPAEEPEQPTPGGETPGSEPEPNPETTPEEPTEPEPTEPEPTEPEPTEPEPKEEPTEPEPKEEPAEPEPKEEPAEQPAQQILKIFVSQDGSDEKGDGSEAAPYASLAKAAAAANAAPDGKAEIILLTDLKALEAAQFTGRELSIRAAEGLVTVTRGEGFKPVKDADGALYNPAMIELRAPEGTELPAGTLSLIGVILDDGGLHEGSVFEQPAQQTEPQPAEEPAAEAEPQPVAEPGEQPAVEPVPETDQPTPAAPADRSDRVQEAIVSVGDGGRLILEATAELRNFGGLSAVRLGDKSTLTLRAGSAIRDTMTVDNIRGTILAAESAVIEMEEGAVLIERQAAPAEEPGAAPNAIKPTDDPRLVNFSFTGTESITSGDFEGRTECPVDYTMSFALNDKARDLVKAMQSGITGSEGTVTITLDPRLTPDLSKCRLESDIFELSGEPGFDESSRVLTASFQLKEDWASHLDDLTKNTSFTCDTLLSKDDFTPGTEAQAEYLESSGKVSISILTTGNTLGPYDSTEKPARTKMLSDAKGTVVYDVNGGIEGSGPKAEEGVPVSPEYSLNTDEVPEHAPWGGVAVVFVGWSLEIDTHIYQTGEQRPQTVETVQVKENETTTVYAVYSLDTNEDGVPDVQQILATLSFDANGGEGAPDPIIHVVGSVDSGELGVDIPEQEPTREYYTFLGWGEKPDAAKTDKLYKFDADKASRRDIPVTKDTTLYAVWQENYKIIYDANGGTDAPEPTVLESMTKTKTDSRGNAIYSGQAEITSEVPTRNGYTFQGWGVTRRSAASFHAGDKVEITGGNVTLYAVWTRGANGGNGKPKTGDEGAGVYAALLSVSAFGLAATGSLLWKKRREET